MPSRIKINIDYIAYDYNKMLSSYYCITTMRYNTVILLHGKSGKTSFFALTVKADSLSVMHFNLHPPLPSSPPPPLPHSPTANSGSNELNSFPLGAR